MPGAVRACLGQNRTRRSGPRTWPSRTRRRGRRTPGVQEHLSIGKGDEIEPRNWLKGRGGRILGDGEVEEEGEQGVMLAIGYEGAGAPCGGKGQRVRPSVQHDMRERQTSNMEMSAA